MNYKKELLADNILLVSIEISEAGLNHSEEFKTFLNQQLSAHAPKLIVDLSKVEYMDSSFIGALVAGLKYTLSKEGEMALINIQPDVLSLFELTRLDKVFKIFNNLNEATSFLK